MSIRHVQDKTKDTALVNASQLINQDSGITEYYTPSEIIEAARSCLGEIDLDPASSRSANERVKAASIYTKNDNGLSLPWRGRVWMNHPFSKGEEPCKSDCTKKTCPKRGYHISERIPGNADWINKLISEYLVGNVRAACCITFASTSEGWFRPLLQFPQCFPYGRINYLFPDGSVAGGVTKGSVITYLGTDINLFSKAFEHIGEIKVIYQPESA